MPKQKNKPVEPVVEAPAVPDKNNLKAAVDRNLSNTQKAYADFLTAQSDYEVDPKSVQLAMLGVSQFRNDPDRASQRAARKAEIKLLGETVEQRAEARRLARAAKLRALADAVEAGEKITSKKKPAAEAVSDDFVVPTDEGDEDDFVAAVDTGDGDGPDVDF